MIRDTTISCLSILMLLCLAAVGVTNVFTMLFPFDYVSIEFLNPKPIETIPVPQNTSCPDNTTSFITCGNNQELKCCFGFASGCVSTYDSVVVCGPASLCCTRDITPRYLSSCFIFDDDFLLCDIGRSNVAVAFLYISMISAFLAFASNSVFVCGRFCSIINAQKYLGLAGLLSGLSFISHVVIWGVNSFSSNYEHENGGSFYLLIISTSLMTFSTLVLSFLYYRYKYHPDRKDLLHSLPPQEQLRQPQYRNVDSQQTPFVQMNAVVRLEPIVYTSIDAQYLSAVLFAAFSAIVSWAATTSTNYITVGVTLTAFNFALIAGFQARDKAPYALSGITVQSIAVLTTIIEIISNYASTVHFAQLVFSIVSLSLFSSSYHEITKRNRTKSYSAFDADNKTGIHSIGVAAVVFVFLSACWAMMTLTSSRQDIGAYITSWLAYISAFISFIFGILSLQDELCITRKVSTFASLGLSIFSSLLAIATCFLAIDGFVLVPASVQTVITIVSVVLTILHVQTIQKQQRELRFFLNNQETNATSTFPNDASNQTPIALVVGINPEANVNEQNNKE